jgi:hypothetical protein
MAEMWSYSVSLLKNSDIAVLIGMSVLDEGYHPDLCSGGLFFVEWNHFNRGMDLINCVKSNN